MNVVNYTPLTRAALENLRLWIEEGIEPPPSAFPRLSDGTAARRDEVLALFAGVPGVALPAVDLLPTLRREDVGPLASEGILTMLVPLGAPYPSHVSAVDADLNEVAGIKMPALTVPIGSHTGWNPRDPATGGVGQIVDMMGSTIPLPREGELGDPRASIVARYSDREDYLSRVQSACLALVSQRHLLEEDVDLVVAVSAERYDAIVARD
jgi:hypothetical protein